MVSVGGKTAAPHYNKHPKILHSKTNVELAFIMFHSSCIIEYAHKYIEINLHKQWLTTCFGKPCAHLRVDKTQKDEHNKEHKMKLQKLSERIHISTTFARDPQISLCRLSFLVSVECGLPCYINTHPLGTYLFWLPFYFPILLTCNYLMSIKCNRISHNYIFSLLQEYELGRAISAHTVHKNSYIFLLVKTYYLCILKISVQKIHLI